MRQLFLDIKARIETYIPEIQFIRMWNSQTEQMEGEEGQEGSAIYPLQLPAVFVEFVNDQTPKQLGNGVQIFDNLGVKLHLVHQQFDAGDGTHEQNLEVFTLKQKLFKYMNLFEPTGAVAFIRNGETQDYDHTNVYHFIQDYVTNYVDFGAQLPVDGVTKQPPTPLHVELSIENTQDPNDPYTIVDNGATVEDYLVSAITGGARITFKNIFDEGIESYKIYRKTTDPETDYVLVTTLEYDDQAATYSYDNLIAAGDYNYKLTCIMAIDGSEIELDDQDITIV